MSARADPKNPARAEGTSYVSNKNNLKSINLDISETTSTLPRVNHLSETKEYRLIQGYLIIKGPNGHNLRARVAIDTQSNVSYSHPSLSTKRSRRPYEITHTVGVKGERTYAGDPKTLTIMKNGKPVYIDTHSGSPHLFSDGKVAILSAQHTAMLGISVDHLLQNEKHVDIKYVSKQKNLDYKLDTIIHALSSLQEREHRRLKKKRVVKKANRVLLQSLCTRLESSNIDGVSCLSNKTIQAFLQRNENYFESKPIDRSSIKHAALTNKQEALFNAVVNQNGSAFAAATNILPPPLKDVLHTFKFKPGAKPVREGRPHFSKPKAQLLMKWVRWARAKDVGLIEKAEKPSYASRLHIAPKYKSNTPKSAPPDGMRFTWAGVKVNDTLQKTVPVYPNAWEQIHKVSKYKYFFSADGLKQYWSIPIHPDHREVTAFWTPEGLYQFTRMVMGTKNAATVAQNAYTKALHEDLHPDALPHIANYADDFLGGGRYHRGIDNCFRTLFKNVSEKEYHTQPREGAVRIQNRTILWLSNKPI